MLSHLLQGAELPEYILADGRKVAWPSREDIGGNASFWVSKEEMRSLMVDAGYGDAKAATKIARFWQWVIPEPRNEAFWWIIAGLLGEPIAAHELVFLQSHTSFEKDKAVVKSLRESLKKLEEAIMVEEKKRTQEK